MECSDGNSSTWIGFRWSVWMKTFAHGFCYFSVKYLNLFFSFCQTKEKYILEMLLIIFIFCELIVFTSGLFGYFIYNYNLVVGCLLISLYERWLTEMHVDLIIYYLSIYENIETRKILSLICSRTI